MPKAATTQSKPINLRKDVFIISSLVSKDFKLKYRRSVLGVIWSVLNPLLMMIVLSAVFSQLFERNGAIQNFPLYLILGLTLFSFMTASTSSGMASIIEAAPLIKKIRVNKFLFPLEKVVFELLNFALSLVAIVLVMVFFGVLPTANVLFLPLLMFYMILFCAGLSLLLAACAVFFRDFIYLWGVVTLAWTYATPIFYDHFQMNSDFLIAVMPFNPMYHYVTYFREIVLWGSTPSLELNLLCLGVALASLALGALVFRKLQKKFILYV
jgi:ABC-2 type transport system permease protein